MGICSMEDIMTWEWEHNKNKIIAYCKTLPQSKGFWFVVVYYLIAIIAWMYII